MKISRDAGHALTTRGKETPDGMKEWEFNNAVCNYMEQYLNEYEAVEQLRVDDPTGQRDVPLEERAKKAREWGSQLHVSAHANAFGSGWNDANGTETWISLDMLPASEKLYAQAVQAEMVKATGLKDRGVKVGHFFMTKVADHVPSILVECGFMTNRKEAELLKSDDYRRLIARAIVDGIAKQAKLKKKEVKAVEKDKPTEIVLSKNQQKDKELLAKHGMMALNYKVTSSDMVALITMQATMVRKLEEKGVL